MQIKILYSEVYLPLHILKILGQCLGYGQQLIIESNGPFKNWVSVKKIHNAVGMRIAD